VELAWWRAARNFPVGVGAPQAHPSVGSAGAFREQQTVRERRSRARTSARKGSGERHLSILPVGHRGSTENGLTVFPALGILPCNH
jgi:hypothetical protein